MQLTEVYTQLGILFLLMFFGYGLGKVNIITSVGTEVFSKFIVKVALPAIIISGMIIPLTPEKLHTAIYIVGLSIATYALAYGVAIGFSKVFIKDRSERGVYSFAIVFSNAGFMGYPVLQALFGKEAIFYGAVYNITFNILLYTLGIKLMEMKGDIKSKFNLRHLINPGITASAIGLILFITGIPLPKFVIGTIDAVGSLCTPLSMITIGAMLSGLPIRKMFSGVKVYLLASTRLIVLPLLTFCLLKYILRIEDSWLLAIPVIVAGMPVASNAAMMAKQYDNNSEIASQTILVSTLFSAVTIPLLAYLL
ncbi:MAG: family transporter [Clostridia bacterium]|jgi:predicted permease|nr:family transporter [Clostridia bacterium]